MLSRKLRRPRCTFWVTRSDAEDVLRELGALWTGEQRRPFGRLWPLVVFIRCAEALAPDLGAALDTIQDVERCGALAS